jgi:hypothetical protein
MLIKNKYLLPLFGSLLILSFSSISHGQTIDEITALQKKKIMNELRKSAGEDKVEIKGDFGSDIGANPDAKFKLKGIYGLENNLSAILETKRFSEFRAKLGDITPEGWKLTQINSNVVQLSFCGVKGTACKKQTLVYGEYLAPVVARSDDVPHYSEAEAKSLSEPLPTPNPASIPKLNAPDLKSSAIENSKEPS